MKREHLKISFCIVSMNRLHHLVETLPANIDDNQGYANLEFLVLDYNSSDGLGEYIQSEMQEHLNSGRVVYYRADAPLYFHRSHSRNLAFKLSSGDIVCNLDADNFTGKGFAFYINEIFQYQQASFLTAFGGIDGKKDVLGRICLKREDFFKVKGYDEQMSSYGFEDEDLVNRLMLAGLQKISIEGNFFKVIPHPEAERLKNEFAIGNLKYLLMNYLSPASTELLFLFKDHSFQKGLLIDNYSYRDEASGGFTPDQKYEYSFLPGSLVKGSWCVQGRVLMLISAMDKGDRLRITYENNLRVFQSKAGNHYVVTFENLIINAVMLLTQLTNRERMEVNLLGKTVVINESGFGKSVVFRNFGSTQLTIK